MVRTDLTHLIKIGWLVFAAAVGGNISSFRIWKDAILGLISFGGSRGGLNVNGRHGDNFLWQVQKDLSEDELLYFACNTKETDIMKLINRFKAIFPEPRKHDTLKLATMVFLDVLTATTICFS